MGKQPRACGDLKARPLQLTAMVHIICCHFERLHSYAKSTVLVLSLLQGELSACSPPGFPLDKGLGDRAEVFEYTLDHSVCVRHTISWKNIAYTDLVPICKGDAELL